MKIQKAFNSIARDYDAQRRKLIPCFDDFYGSVAKAILLPKSTPLHVLDLGAGTGILSEFILRTFPKARVTLCDFAPQMLEEASRRFGDDDRVSYLCMDYTKAELPEDWDAIVSSLSIHHLTAAQKKSLYRGIYAALKRGGFFVNADNVKGPTLALDCLYKEEWLRHVKGSGISKKELKAALERTKLDKFSPLDNQLQWLREAGFRQVDCLYKNFQRAVFGGKK